MNYDEALATLSGDVLNAIKGHVKALESKGAIANTIASSAASMGITETEPLAAFNKILSNLQSSQKDLSSKENELVASKATQVNLETQLKTLRLEKTLSDSARLTGCQPEVLSRLVAGSEDKLKVDGDRVTYDGKPIKEFAESNDSWKPFLPALFPSTSQAPSQPPNPPVNNQQPGNPTPAPTPPAPVNLPSGGNQGNPQEKSLVSEYMNRTYPGLKVPQSA